MTKKSPPYAGAYDVGLRADDFERATVVVVVHEVRQSVLSQEARDDIRAKARAKAVQTMTEAEWEACRQASGDPVHADVDMAFGVDEPGKPK